MAAISKPKLSFTVFALLLLLANTLVHSQDVTTFSYGPFDSTPNPDELIYQGDTHVPEGITSLQLTKTNSSGYPMSWSTGRVLHSWPVQLWEESPVSRLATFETTIRFFIRPSKQGAANGLVFFIAPPNAVFDKNSGGGNMGIFNGSAGGKAAGVFAVEFDTFVNRGWDPKYRHIGINIESRKSRKTTKFDSGTGELVTTRIKYNSKTKTITVVASTDTQRAASVSYVLDLKTILPRAVEVGISASTGKTVSYLAIIDLITWEFNSTLVH